MKRSLLALACGLGLLLAAPAPALALPGADWNTPYDTPAVTVGATPTALLPSPGNAGRRVGFVVQPIGGNIVIIGPAGTSSTGFVLYDGQQLTIDTQLGSNWYAVRQGGADVPTRVVPVYY